MAGAGFKTFNTGDVLTASDVNTYLMQQTVMVFDDASARSTALPTPSEGMFSYLKDTNLTYRYDGSAWLSDAGTTSPLTTKGDLWTYSTTDARLPVGTDGYTLVADSAETTGLKWAAAGGGKVLQVVSSVITTSTLITAQSFTDTSITGTITPTSASSKILVMIMLNRRVQRNSSAAITGHRLLRGATEIVTWGNNQGYGIQADGASVVQLIDQAPLIYLDSPATTSATTYKVQAQVETAGETTTYQYGSKASTITFLEIGA